MFSFCCQGNGYLWKGFHPVSMQEAMYRGLGSRPQDLSGIMKVVCLAGEYLERACQNKYYSKAQNLTMALTSAYDRALSQYDVLVMPTLPYKATKLPAANASLMGKLDL